MSVQSEITRIQEARNSLRTKEVSLGIGLATDNLTQLATKYNGIVDRGTPSASVQEGDTYTIQPGYYHGGTVQGVAGGGNYNLQAKTATPTKSEITVSADTGYYGLSAVTINPIPAIYQDVSSVTAAAGDVLATKVIVDSEGAVTAGTMPNRGAWSNTLKGNALSVTIPAGYHNGSGSVSITTESKTFTPSETTQTYNVASTSSTFVSSITVNPIPSEYADASNADIAAGDVLVGKTAIGYNSQTGAAVEVEGTMPNNGAWSWSPTVAATSMSVPAGYHNGSGSVSISLESKTYTPTESTQTYTVPNNSSTFVKQITVNPIPANYMDASGADVVAGNILAGKVAIGYDATTHEAIEITGTMTNRGAVSQTLQAGQSYTVPAGYHSGSGTVTAASLASQTGVDSGKDPIESAYVLTGYQGWVNGSKVSGSMANNGAINGTITGLGAVTGDTSYTIPAGYTTGGTVSLTSDIETALAAI